MQVVYAVVIKKNNSTFSRPTAGMPGPLSKGE